MAAVRGWAGGWAGGLGRHQPALSDVTNSALGLGGWAALEAGAAAVTAECSAPSLREAEGEAEDQGAPVRSYVPRRHLRATATTHGAPPPPEHVASEHGGPSAAAALLPRLPDGSELPPLGYRSRVQPR